MTRLTLLRAIALALLLATVAGPLGVAGALHPLDDVACRVGVPSANESAVYRSPGVASPGDLHCTLCHALRSVRWGLTSSGVSAHGAVLVPLIAPVYLPEFSAVPRGTCRGRSPPSSARAAQA